MKAIKSTETHIEEIEKLLKTFDDGFEKIFVNMKKTNLKNLKKDIQNYQKVWKKFFNEESLNKNSENKVIDQLTFEKCDLLRNLSSDMAPVPPTFQRGTRFIPKK